MAPQTDPLSMSQRKAWSQPPLTAEETMEENGTNGGIETQSWWWWGVASMAQLGWGISSFRKGCDSHLMPFKAFAVAALFVGSGASASIAALQASGIHNVTDLLEVGANIRTGLGIPPRVPKKKADDLQEASRI